MPIERGKIREYATATGATHAGYFSGARAPVPPTFLSTVIFWADIAAVFADPEAIEAFAAAGVARGWERLLSLEQEYVFPSGVPHAGDELTIAHRFDGITQKEGRRGGSMLMVRFAVEFLAPAGALVAECRYLSAYVSTPAVGAPSAASPAPSADAVVAGVVADVLHEKLAERTFGTITMTDIVRYQGASGDMNPMHHDDELARAAGYPAAFSVGMLGAGYLASTCVGVFGTETVRRFRTCFRDLVWRGSTLTATVRRTGALVVDDERRTVVELTLTTDAGTTAITGEAEFASP
jgi:acyl dehydratase